MQPDWKKSTDIWRNAAFVHMEQKNAALKELATLREEHDKLKLEHEQLKLEQHNKLKQDHETLYFQSWTAVLAVWLWGIVCVFYALKINP